MARLQVAAVDLNSHENSEIKVLRAGVDATVRNEAGDSDLKLSAVAGLLQLANQIVHSGQCMEIAGDEVRRAVLNERNNFKAKLSLLDWLVFSCPTSEREKHYALLQRHGVWPKDLNNPDDRRDALRLACKEGCSAIAMHLLNEADEPVFIKELLSAAASSGSWVVMKVLASGRGPSIFDRDTLKTALVSLVKHRYHYAVNEFFMLNKMLVQEDRLSARSDISTLRSLSPNDIQDVFLSVASQKDFRMLDSLIKSGANPSAPAGEWRTGPSEPLSKQVLQAHQAWATLDYIWCAQGVDDEVKRFLRVHGMWPHDEGKLEHIIATMVTVMEAGCTNVLAHLESLPVPKEEQLPAQYPAVVRQ